VVGSYWKEHPNYRKATEWLEKMRPDLAVSAETLADIIKAGKAGLLTESP
jgi:hypothetical protein